MTSPAPTISPSPRVLILANPRAGTGRSLRVVEQLVRSLRARRLEPILCWRREELSELVSAHGRDAFRCVVAAGGDGTLLEVINRAPGLPAALLPLGNENLVARFCGVKRSGVQVADLIAAGRLRTVDLARADGRLFALMAGAGFDALVVHQVHRRRRGFVNKLSYALPVVRALRDYRYPPIDVEIEETGERLRGALVFVFNLPQYAMDLPVGAGAVPDDGWLDLCVFERPGLWHLARYLTAVLRGRQGQMPDVHRRRVRRVRLSSGEKVPLQTDGDPAGWLPATIEVVPRALTLVLPP